MTRTQLSAVPIDRRRRAALALGVMAGLLAVIGVLPWTAAAPMSVRVIAVAALLAALLAGLLAWGLARSATLDERQADEAQLDRTLVAAAGGVTCDCGHDHLADGTLQHTTVVDAPCDPADSPDCPHTCETCVLAQLR